MPIEDTIFKRIRIARDAEVAALARILGEKCSISREYDIITLSKELRSAGGNSFRNAFRSDHDLPYLEILRDRAKHVSSQNKWESPHQKVSPPDNATAETWLENYIAEAATAFARRARGQIDEEGFRQAQVRAQAAMNGEQPPKKELDAGNAAMAAAGMIALGAVGAAGAAGVAVGVAALLPVASLGGVVAMITEPSEAKMLSAVLVLIHIRRRHETGEHIQLACRRTP